MKLHFFFNFRSPYCYLVSKRVFDVIDGYRVELDWRPLGGWSGRSPPERAKKKIPLTRQDVARWARRYGIPLNPPPNTTEPTLAALGSLLAEERGVLREWIVEVMRAEWAEGKDIGQAEVLFAVGDDVGLPSADLSRAFESAAYRERLDENATFAEKLGVMGVPSWVIGEQIFWGNDRLDFLEEHLSADLRLARR